MCMQHSDRSLKRGTDWPCQHCVASGQTSGSVDQYSTRRRTRRTWLVEGCFTSTETVGLLGTGAQDGHLDFHTASELCQEEQEEEGNL